MQYSRQAEKKQHINYNCKSGINSFRYSFRYLSNQYLHIFGYFILFIILITPIIFANPSGPTFSIISNSTRNITAGTLVNSTSGGYIYTVRINATTQNERWKAFVGNVSGSLALDDAKGDQLFTWNLSSVTGEVYATRSATSISWSQIECANSTDISAEDNFLGQTNGNDNITATFSSKNHTTFMTGEITIAKNTCNSIHTFVNGITQKNSFQEMIIKDLDGGELVFVTTLENSVTGYNGNSYDFQMIVPENGTAGWSGSTPYYFYTEVE